MAWKFWEHIRIPESICKIYTSHLIETEKRTLFNDFDPEKEIRDMIRQSRSIVPSGAMFRMAMVKGVKHTGDFRISKGWVFVIKKRNKRSKGVVTFIYHHSGEPFRWVNGKWRSVWLVSTKYPVMGYDIPESHYPKEIAQAMRPPRMLYDYKEAHNINQRQD